MAESWMLEGTYFEACNCEVACPCVFLSDPTEGECYAFVGWHIDEGSRGDVSLAGKNVAVAIHSPGNMVEVDWKLALYLDETSSDEQQEALTEIFTGQAGGHFETIAGHVEEVMGIHPASITYESNGNRQHMIVDQVMEAEIEAIEGQGEQQVAIQNHPLAISPGFDAVVSRSNRLTYDDHGYSWEISDHNGFYSPFHYEGP